MAGKSNYLEAAIINHLLRTTALAQPTSVHVALFTAAPTDAGGGTEVSTAGTNYSRASVSRADASWSAPSGTPRAVTNAGTITFATPSASWGNATHFGIFDSAIGGSNNLLYWAALSAAKTINANDLVTIAPGALSITED